MTKDMVDVLFIGAGASGAAIAWSLAKTGDAHCLPGAGRLGQSGELSQHRTGLGISSLG